jgi:hypothetical protein
MGFADPRDAQIDQLAYRQRMLALPRLGPPRGLRNVLAATDLGLQQHRLGARVTDVENFSMIGADLDRPALVRSGIGVLQVEGRRGAGVQAGVEAADGSIVMLDRCGYFALA